MKNQKKIKGMVAELYIELCKETKKQKSKLVRTLSVIDGKTGQVTGKAEEFDDGIIIKTIYKLK